MNFSQLITWVIDTILYNRGHDLMVLQKPIKLQVEGFLSLHLIIPNIITDQFQDWFRAKYRAWIKL
jgi:hypothetical protein